jgi:UDP-3-O-[3-hydroxymyristoyl] glucosamine N-acyltransferase
MPATLASLAELVGGHLLGASPGDLPISGAATLDDARAGEITMADLATKANRLARSAASAVLVPLDFAPEQPPAIQVDDVHRAFATIVTHFRPLPAAVRIGISPAAIVSPRARLAADVDVHPGAMIGDDVEIGSHSTIHSGARLLGGCKLGAGVTVYPNAVLYERTVVGDRAVIHAGAVLGAHGFGYKLAGGKHQLSAQLGNVEIGCDVEIGACSTIDRGTYGPTIVGEGTKIDNQVMIAHNCRIGRHNLICSQVGVAGSTTTGDYVVMAGQVGVRDHVNIGAGAILGAKAGVSGDVPEGAHMLGSPAVPLRDQRIQYALFSRLPDMRKQLKELQRQVDALAAGQLTVAKNEQPNPNDQAAA